MPASLGDIGDACTESFLCNTNAVLLIIVIIIIIFLQSYGKGARRKNRFKGSDGSTSSDTTSNSFVRQVCCFSAFKRLHNLLMLTFK